MEAFIIIATGIVSFYVAIKFRQKTNKLLQKGVKTEGIVLDFVESDNINSHTSYPIIQFLTLDKKWVTGEYGISKMPNLFKKGQKVSVIYNPDNPKEFFIKSGSAILMPILALVLAIILLTVGLYKLYV